MAFNGIEKHSGKRSSIDSIQLIRLYIWIIVCIPLIRDVNVVASTAANAQNP